jgi:predicted transcriptional regulator
MFAPVARRDTMTAAFALDIDDETAARLRALSETHHRSPADLAHEAIAAYLEREEERAEDEARWQRYVATGEAVDQDRVAAWLERIGTDDEPPCPR